MKLKNKKTEKRCIQCGRIIVDKKNKTGLCPKCAKKDVGVGVAAAALAPGIVVGIKKYGKTIGKGITTVAKVLLKR